MKRAIGLLWVPFFAIFGCEQKENGTNAGPEVRSNEMRGIVRGFDFAAGHVVIEHEDVPGFMNTMTMPFAVRDGLQAVQHAFDIGDGIAFRFVISGNESWIEKMEAIPAETVTLPGARSSVVRENRTRLKEGDPLPDFGLIDQDGEPLSRAHYAGRQLVLTFIFTRCPVPDFCPLMSSNFEVLQRSIADASGTDALLLSVTIDPEFDTPQVLSDYGVNYARDPEIWTFATGDAAAIGELSGAFSVLVQPEAGTLAHGLATALVDAEGVIRKIWRGNRWKPEEVLSEIAATDGAKTGSL